MLNSIINFDMLDGNFYKSIKVLQNLTTKFCKVSKDFKNNVSNLSLKIFGLGYFSMWGEGI